MKNRKSFTIYFFLLIICLNYLSSCSNENAKQTTELEGNDSTILFANDWNQEMYVRLQDSFESSLSSLLMYYGIKNFNFEEHDIISLPLYGTTYLPVLERIQNDYGITSTFVETDYSGIIHEIKANRPVLSFRMVRNKVEDVVLFTGYDQSQQELIAFTILNKEPIAVKEEQWNNNYHNKSDMRLTIFSSTDETVLQSVEKADTYFLQAGISIIHSGQHDKMAEIIENIENRQLRDPLANNIRNFYYLIVKKELHEDVVAHTNLLYDVAPNASYTNEFMFHRYLLEGDSEKMWKVLQRFSTNEWYVEFSLATLYLLQEIYTEQNNIDQLDKVNLTIYEKEL